MPKTPRILDQCVAATGGRLGTRMLELDDLGLSTRKIGRVIEREFDVAVSYETIREWLISNRVAVPEVSVTAPE